jgi:hypothetical protein
MMRHDGRFRVSRFCSGGNCVGVRVARHHVDVTAVGDESSEPLRFTREEWAAFLSGVKAGEFDLD